MTPAAESAFRKVQRPLEELPVLHLEPSIPTPQEWSLRVEGMAANHPIWTADEVHNMPIEKRTWDLNCVWGWVKRDCVWEGIPASRFIDSAGPLPEATHVVAKAIEGDYASCLTMAEARESLVAWRMDGQDLTPEHGAPMRLVAPPDKWGYKSIKWLGCLKLVGKFEPGFWEELVGNPHGDIPDELIENRFE